MCLGNNLQTRLIELHFNLKLNIIINNNYVLIARKWQHNDYTKTLLLKKVWERDINRVLLQF